jgi:hypothetical protein
MKTYFNNGADIFCHDLQRTDERLFALALVAPGLHKDVLAKTEALNVWVAEQDQHDKEHARLSEALERARHQLNALQESLGDDDDSPATPADAQRAGAEVDRLQADIAALKDPGPRPPAPPDVTAQYVLANITPGWEVSDTPPGPTPEQLAEQAHAARVEKYAQRLLSAPKLIAQFSADNERRLASGVWTLAQLQSVIQDARIGQLVMLLNMASFESAVALVGSLSGGVYTTELKQEWIAKIRAAM